ncbi:MAG: hypothetical protein E7313_00965 [Clostridiales bacterium]|nr:hypothetical protein [Clostridiales bacterium]
MQKEKSIGRNILIVVLILVTIASVCAGLFAWAKYQTTINGTATGETAKWSFKVSDGNTSTQEIEFPMTRTDNNTSVAEGKIAPGTYGELEIGIDATGTETALTYIIEGTMENRPTNMKFYSDAERTLELTVIDNKFSKGGYMNLNEVGVKTEKIYWEWPFETGSTAELIEKNDAIDIQDSEKTISMQVSVTGKQLNGAPRLADLVQVGDYVNYDATASDSNGNVYSYTVESELTGTTRADTFTASDVFNSQAKAQWRVLNVDRTTGEVELMSVEPTSSQILVKGVTGFANFETVDNDMGLFDKASAVYGHGNGAISARSINMDDIMKYVTYNPKTDYTNEYSSNGKIGGTRTFESGTFIKGVQYRDEGGEMNDTVTGGTDNGDGTVTASGDNKVTVTQTAFGNITEEHFINSLIYNMLSKNSTDISTYKSNYAFSNRYTNLHNKEASFFVKYVANGKISNNNLKGSGSFIGTALFAVVPVVSLEKNIQTIGQNADGVWQLKVE